MDNKEAIKIIKKCMEHGFRYTFYSLNEYNEAINMAVKALEQQPCEDAISRQEVIVKAKYWIAMQETRTGFIEKRGYFVDVDDVKALPSVQPTACIAKISFDDQKMKEMIDRAISNLDFSDLISRQAAIDAIAETLVNGESLGYSLAHDILFDLPSVQPEQKIIRCKDCKHLYQDGECPLRLWKYHVENDYCSYGETIEKEGE